MPRRRAGSLTPLQREVLQALVDVRGEEDDRVHGFALADRLRGGAASRALIGHGTLYKVLGRLLEDGLATAVWEDPAVAEAAHRPRRRFYTVTAAGVVAAARLDAEDAAPAATLRPAPS